MGSRYLFIVLYLWLEKYFSRGPVTESVGPTLQVLGSPNLSLFLMPFFRLLFYFHL